MSKTYKTVTQTKTTAVIDSTACDICGKTKRGNNNWTGGTWNIERVTVQIEEGEVFPEIGTTETLEYDICPECFRTRLVAFLASLGATGTTKEHRR